LALALFFSFYVPDFVMSKAIFSVKFFGRVQGVGFRFFVLKEANKRKITGWVKNSWESDLVEALFQGEEKNVKEFIEFLKKPAYWIRVDKLVVEEIDSKEKLNDFQVKY
jgi:acylphosphatase